MLLSLFLKSMTVVYGSSNCRVDILARKLILEKYNKES